jgi:hypothetical protein
LALTSPAGFCNAAGGCYAHEPRYLKRIPIVRVTPAHNLNRSRHDRIERLVQQLLELYRQLRQQVGHASVVTQCVIEAADGQIDRLVYELYGLTEEEIAIVEEATQR